VPSKTNTDKIFELNGICANLTARLDALVTEVRANAEEQRKALDSLPAVTAKLTAVEIHVSGIEALKAAVAGIAVLEKDLALLQKDMENLSKWKDELKKEKDEASRRLAAFGPNVVAALISGIMSAGIALLVLWLNKPK
jgi:hypothetical protein